MLSLLSLLLASGTVLRADTDEWTPDTYPDPRTNSTLCNTWENSTLCDPDHMLTDFWRNKINENIINQMEKLKDANVQYADKAPMSCLENTTEPVKIYVLLAKRIHTANNQTITEEDLTNFGNKLTQRFGFDKMSCKNFLLLIGVEAAKLAYVRTGKDLKLPADLMQKVFNEYNSFNAINYMEGLNKIVDEIGAQISDPFKDLEELIREYTMAPMTKSVTEEILLNELTELNILNETNANNDTLIILKDEESNALSMREAPWLILLLMGTTIIMALFVLMIFWMKYLQRRKILKEFDKQRPQRLKKSLKQPLRLLWRSKKPKTNRRDNTQDIQNPKEYPSESLHVDIESIAESLEGVAHCSTSIKNAQYLKHKVQEAKRKSASFSV